MKEPIWLTEELVMALHDRQIAEHSGSSGVRDKALLESALARPRQLFAYGGPDTDIPDLAASCAYGIARNHAFVDGNKRTATVCCELFIELNGMLLLAEDADFYPVVIAMATGEISESQFAEWLRANSRPQGVNERQSGYR